MNEDVSTELSRYSNYMGRFEPPVTEGSQTLSGKQMYKHISGCTKNVYELPLLPINTTAKHFYTNQGGGNCWLDIYSWGTVLAVTGRTRDIGQNVLQSAFRTGSCNSHSYRQILFFIAFLDQAFIRIITIILSINYQIMILIN